MGCDNYQVVHDRLFAEVLPIETVLRIWDCLFYEGSKIIFGVCLTLIKRNQVSLLQCSDFSSLADVSKRLQEIHWSFNAMSSCRVFSRYLDHCHVV
ncbi:hypothetical protein L9F63_028176 [Diploptera punctata]|uniref:Rab-GAP TBC domain-containing protein n=1 Tax=Diploptera punctata TaxID=6984 RepID=A0AAD8EFK6_DIPPU|nr:hypothetical protein L9F63_028176 [Diploptera punctata]